MSIWAVSMTACLKAGTWVPTEGENSTSSDPSSSGGSFTESAGSNSTTESTRTSESTESTTDSTSSTTEDSESSSGGMDPICGNDILEAGEECDDGGIEDGAADGCNLDCVRDRIVFVTDSTYSGNLGGLAGADEKCQSAAKNADLSGTFMAWLSDESISPKTRFTTQSSGRYVLVDKNTLVANNWDELATMDLLNPINMTELAGTLAENGEKQVWTNTSVDGNSASDFHCDSWTNGTDGFSGQGGIADMTNNLWTEIDQPIFCNLEIRLYCFEQ